MTVLDRTKQKLGLNIGEKCAFHDPPIITFAIVDDSCNLWFS